MNKRLTIFTITLILISISIFFNPGLSLLEAEASSGEGVYFFYSHECDVCIRQQQEIKRLLEERSGYFLAEYEISQNNHNLELMFFLLERFGDKDIDFSIPIIFIRGQVLAGEKDIEKNLEIIMDNPVSEPKDEIGKALEQYEAKASRKETGAGSIVTLPVAMVAAAMDSINPCAITIILFLIGSLFLSIDKKKVLLYGSIYIVPILVVYLGIGLGFIYFLESINISPVFFVVLGSLLIAAGLFSIKDYFWYGRGPSLGMPGFAKKLIQTPY